MTNQIQLSNKCTEIVVQEAVSTLPETLKKYALAKQSPIISKMEKADAVKIINAAILKVIFDLGWNKKAENASEENQDRILTAGNCFDLIKDKYNNLTTGELTLAFLKGSLGEYGTYIGLGLKTLSDWLKGYSNDELKKKAMSEWNKAIDQVSIKEKTPEQKEAIIRDGCLHSFNDYKANCLIIPVDHLCGVFYVYLKEKGLIKFSEAKRIELYDLAKAEYLSGLNRFRGQIAKDIYGSLLQSMTAKKDEPQNRSFGNMCKRYALLAYFDELIASNTELNELLK